MASLLLTGSTQAKGRSGGENIKGVITFYGYKALRIVGGTPLS
jgi:hypothetical protein